MVFSREDVDNYYEADIAADCGRELTSSIVIGWSEFIMNNQSQSQVLIISILG